MLFQSPCLMLSLVLMFQLTSCKASGPQAAGPSPTIAHPSAHSRRFSTKTAYNASIAMDLHQEKAADSSAAGDSISKDYYLREGGRECRPMQVVGLFRHGTRFPGVKDVLKVRTALEKIQSAATSRLDLVRALTDSVGKFSVEDDKLLAHAGREEHRTIGARFGARFVKLFDAATARSDVEFISSDKPRTIDSCTSFQEGFASSIASFDEDSSFTRSDLHFLSVRDDLLRFFDHCNAYVSSVVQNKTALKESHKFKLEWYPSIAERVGKIFETKEPLDFNPGEMKSMYVIGASELAIHGTSSWDQLFTDHDLELLEYASDIRNYWKKSYGYSINYEPSCVLVNHMFEHMDNLVNAKSHKKGVFYFGHTETVIPVLSLLGLFRDAEPLRADNFASHPTRQFRTSRIAPFSSNLVFVLYECQADADSNGRLADEERYVVEFLFKERPLVIPVCGRTSCPYAAVRRHYAAILDRCHFEEMCAETKPDRGHSEL